MLSRIIFCLLLAVFPAAAVVHSDYAPAEGIIEGFIFILACLSIAARRFNVLTDSRTRHLLYPVLGIVGLALVQTLTSGFTARLPISADQYETKLFAIKLLALIVFARLLAQHVSNKRRLQILVGAIVSVGVLCCAFGLVKYLLQLNFQPSNSFIKQSFGQFENRNHFAFLMEMTLGLVLGLMTLGWRRGRFLFLLIASLLIWVAVLLTLSRGAFVSITIEVIFFSVVYLAPSNRRFVESKELQIERFSFLRVHLKNAAIVLSIIVALTAGILIVGGNAVTQRLSSLSQELNQNPVHRSYTRRREIWSATLRLIRANPVTGIGFGGFAAAIPQYYDATGEFNLQQAHSDYLELLASGGFIAGCFGTWFVIVLIINGFKRLQSSGDAFARAIILGSSTGIAGVAVHSAVDFGLHIFINAIFFTALVVLVSTAAVDKEKRKIWPSFHARINPFLKKVVAYSVAGMYLLIFTTAIWASGTASVSRLLACEGIESGRLQASLYAVRLNPSDPEVHSRYALMLFKYRRFLEASREYETATALRPRDFSLWLRLARTYQQLGDYQEARECFARSSHQAPYYAEPHWELGTLLLKLGQRDNAFQELNAAERSNPELLKPLLHLAWKEYNGDPASVIKALNPQTDAKRIVLAHFFAQNNSPDAAFQMYRSVIELSEKDRAALVRAFQVGVFQPRKK